MFGCRAEAIFKEGGDEDRKPDCSELVAVKWHVEPCPLRSHHAPNPSVKE